MTPPSIAIIGAGPIGLETAAALRARGAEAVVLDAGPIGSTLTWWAPGTRFFSSPERIAIAGLPLVTPDQDKATREQYLAYLRAVVGLHGLDVRTHRRVTRIERAADGFRLLHVPSRHGVGGPAEHARTRRAQVDAGAPTEALDVRAVVLAIGNLHQPRTVGVPGEDGPHASHFLGDPHDHAGRRVCIVGGKNSAVEAAIRLYRVGARVTMSYRGDAFDAKRVKYWLRPEIEWLIAKGRIAWHPRTMPRAIGAGFVRLGPVGEAGPSFEVPTDHALVLTGYVQDPDLFEQLGVELRGPTRAPAFEGDTMETGVAGAYVAGTAAGGSQERARLFIENSHVHVERICRALTGESPPWPSVDDYSRLEEA